MIIMKVSTRQINYAGDDLDGGPTKLTHKFRNIDQAKIFAEDTLCVKELNGIVCNETGKEMLVGISAIVHQRNYTGGQFVTIRTCTIEL